MQEAGDLDQALETARRFARQADRATLESLASLLEEAESRELQQEPLLQRLGDALGELRELGRRFLGLKAENLATSRQEPALYAAEVPFRFGEDEGNARLQVFARRRRKGSAAWNARVVLDLQTSRLGPILGDMGFTKQSIALTLYCRTDEAARTLEASAQELHNALAAKGFRCSPRFLVMAGESPPSPAGRTRPAAGAGRLDIEI